ARRTVAALLTHIADSGGDLNADEAGAGAADGDVLLDQGGKEDELVLLVVHPDTAVHAGLLARLQVATEAPAVRVGRPAEIGAAGPVEPDAPVARVFGEAVLLDRGKGVQRVIDVARVRPLGAQDALPRVTHDGVQTHLIATNDLQRANVCNHHRRLGHPRVLDHERAAALDHIACPIPRTYPEQIVAARHGLPVGRAVPGQAALASRGLDLL